jgi:hypothetical protein
LIEAGNRLRSIAFSQPSGLRSRHAGRGHSTGLPRDQCVVIFSRNDHRGFLALPQSEDIERAMNTLPWDAEVECVINGVSVTSAELLRRQYRNVPPSSCFSGSPGVVPPPRRYRRPLADFNGFIEGDKNPDGQLLNRFRPDEPINRAEVAKIIALVREVAKE